MLLVQQRNDAKRFSKYWEGRGYEKGDTQRFWISLLQDVFGVTDPIKAHRVNDAAVLEAYGFPEDASESEIVARLFKMYQELTIKS